MLAILGVSCKTDAVKEDEKDPVLQRIGGDYYEDLIRTPVNLDGTLDTANMARIDFENTIFNFGVLEQSDKREHIFKFENRGTIPLIILSVKSSCGCTIPSYSETPIQPGGEGEIILNYNPEGKKGVQEKKVIVTSNAFPNKTELTIIADVIKND